MDVVEHAKMVALDAKALAKAHAKATVAEAVLCLVNYLP